MGRKEAARHVCVACPSTHAACRHSSNSFPSGTSSGSGTFWSATFAPTVQGGDRSGSSLLNAFPSTSSPALVVSACQGARVFDILPRCAAPVCLSMAAGVRGTSWSLACNPCGDVHLQHCWSWPRPAHVLPLACGVGMCVRPCWYRSASWGWGIVLVWLGVLWVAVWMGWTGRVLVAQLVL